MVVVPKLNFRDPLIRAADIFSPLDNHLADPRSLLASQDSKAIAISAQSWQLAMGQIWRRGEQKVFGSVIVNIGIPVGRAADTVMGVLEFLPPELDRLLEQAFFELKSAIREAVAVLTKEVLEKVIGVGVEVATSLMSAIPVVGWIAGIVIGLAKAIVKLVQTVRKQNEREKFLYDRAEFSPDLDFLIANRLCLDVLSNSKDWTNLFLPLGSRWTRLDLKGGGFRYSPWKPTNPGEPLIGETERPSFCPGTNTILRQWEIDGPTTLISTGDYLPSAREVCTSAWGLVNQPGPSMFCVNPADVRMTWNLLLSKLHAYIETLEQPQAKLVRDMAKRQFGGDWSGNWPQVERTARPMQAAKTLGERQRLALESARDPKGPIWAAYVGDDYGAFSGFGGGDRLISLEISRRAILERRILPQVDFDVIPPGEFKNALRDRFLRASSIATGPLQGKDPTPGLDLRSVGNLSDLGLDRPGLSEAPSPGSEIVVIPENEIRDPSLPRPSQNPDPSSGGGAAALVALAAAGLVGWTLYGR